MIVPTCAALSLCDYCDFATYFIWAVRVLILARTALLLPLVMLMGGFGVTAGFALVIKTALADAAPDTKGKVRGRS